MRFSDLPPTGTVVWGLGREGRAVVAACAARGVDVAVALPDERPGDADLLRGAAVVVKSPGVPVTSPLYADLTAAGVPVTSLTDLWMSEHAARAVGVTGTKGKSTTASLVAHLVRALGPRSAVVGNVGTPLPVDPTVPDELDVVVVEVSSYQAQSLTRSPRVAVVTSLFPEHLPWHGGFEAYAHDKLTLVAHGPGRVVCGSDPALVARVVARAGSGVPVVVAGTDPGPRVDADGGVDWAGVGQIAPGDLPLRGRHNAENVVLALLAVDALGLLPDDAARRRALAAVPAFTPLAHRLETIPSRDGRTWVDDSLATAPEAVVAALTVHDGRDGAGVALLAGGADRGLPLDPLVDHLRARTAPLHLLLFGATGRRLAAALAAPAVPHAHAVQVLPDFAAAVRAGLALPDDVRTVLFSPGAPSFDEYADYRARADDLRRLVTE